MKNIMNDSGFSLMEIMIAVGLTSVLFLGITSGLKMMAKGQATSETKMEELEIRRQIMSLLSDKLACQNTFANFKIGDPIVDIKTTSNNVAFKVGNSYGNNSLKITALVTRDNAQVLSNGAKSVDLVISFQKMKKLVSQTNVNTTVSLAVITKAGGLIETCFSDTEAIISSATNQSCTSLGGVWNGTKCSLPTCEPGQVLQGISDTGAICKTLICGDGEILKGIDASGNVVCVPNVPTYQ